MTKKYRGDAFAAIHETMEGLLRIPVIVNADSGRP